MNLQRLICFCIVFVCKHYLYFALQGVQMRDEMVFQCAFDSKIPIVMLLSGGYLKKSAKYVACSIRNLKEKGLIYGQSQQ